LKSRPELTTSAISKRHRWGNIFDNFRSISKKYKEKDGIITRLYWHYKNLGQGPVTLLLEKYV